MDDFKIDISGIDDVQKNLLALGGDLGAKTLRASLRAAAKPMLEAQIANVPVSSEGHIYTSPKGKVSKIESGFLKSRIKMKTSLNTGKGVSKTKMGKNDAALVRVGVFRAGYAGFVEFGNPKHSAQPFIRPSLSKATDVIATFRKDINKRIERGAKRLARKKAAGK